MRSLIASSCLFFSVACASQVKPVHTSISHATITKAAPVEAKKTNLLRQEFALVTNQNEKMFLVLSSDVGEEVTASEPFLMSYRENEVVLKKVIQSAPDSVMGWKGQAVSLFEDGEKSCNAFVKDVYLQGNLYIDSETFPFGRDLAEEPMTDAEFAQMSWESGRVLLVAELANTGGCQSASFGRLASLGEPTLTTQKEATMALEDEALKAFRALPEYQEIQSEYVSGGYPSFEGREVSERWENYEGAKTKVSLFETKEKKQLVSASVDIWYGCGDFEARLFALWEVQGDRSLKLISTSTNGINPQELVDVEGDGVFEILQDMQWYQMQNQKYQTTEILYIPWDVPVCPC